jgi:peptide deformylase
MSVLPIRKLGEPVLREPCKDVDHFDNLLHHLFEDMVETMYKAPGVGLAAPQVGISLRFFVFDANDGEGPKAVANPVLSAFEGEQIEDEGCLSIPNLWHETARAMKVRLDGQDLKGKPISYQGEELRARIFQHETDHLNGILFVDRLSEEDRRQAMAAMLERDLGGDDDGPQGRFRRGRPR